MLKEERYNIILNEIRKHNKVQSNSLSKILNVSEDTIRRDLKELSDNGYIKKVHGGAMANPFVPLATKSPNVTDQKEHSIIARKALEIIDNKQVILMEGDESNLLLVSMLPHDFTATIFTNSLSVASKLNSYPNIEAFLLGGKMSPKAPVTIGLDVVTALKEVHADICFIEASSIHIDIGLTDSDRERTHIKKAMIDAASEAVLMCLSRRLGQIQPFKMGGLENAHYLITDLKGNSKQLSDFTLKGLQIP